MSSQTEFFSGKFLVLYTVVRQRSSREAVTVFQICADHFFLIVVVKIGYIRSTEAKDIGKYMSGPVGQFLITV